MEIRDGLKCLGALMCIFGGLAAGKYKNKKSAMGGIIALIGLLLVLYT